MNAKEIAESIAVNLHQQPNDHITTVCIHEALVDDVWRELHNINEVITHLSRVRLIPIGATIH